MRGRGSPASGTGLSQRLEILLTLCPIRGGEMDFRNLRAMLLQAVVQPQRRADRRLFGQGHGKDLAFSGADKGTAAG